MSAVSYQYKGYHSDGRRVEGEIVAASLEEAERKVIGQDVIVISLKPATRAAKSATESEQKVRSGRSVSDGDAAAILKNLAVMVESGVPFLEALDAVADCSSPATAARLKEMRKEIIAGRSLSQAMRSAPGLFPNMVSDMVRVAEEGGRLEQALQSSSAYLQRAADLRRRILSAMIYPTVMLSVSLLTVVILIVFVLPRFSAIFKSMKADIPVSTQLMLSGGDAIRNHPLLSVAAVVAVTACLVWSVRNQVSRRAISNLASKLPIVGDLLQRLALARAIMSISTLLRSNVSLMAALEHGAMVASNPRISNGLMEARASVEHGTALSDSLEASKVFPATLLQMVRVGERTGRLHTLLAASAERLEEESDAKLKALVALVEPAMIVVMGVVVGTITISIISPIYSVVQNVK
jgi:type II secretory pathway component PulF